MLALSFLLARDGSRYRPIIHDASAIEIAIENNWQDYFSRVTVHHTAINF